MEFLKLDAKEFDEFALNHPLGGFWQSSDMAHMQEKNGSLTYYVGVKENGKLLGASMLTLKKIHLGYYFARSLRGPLLDYGNEELVNFFMREVFSFLKNKKVLFYHIDPYLPLNYIDLEGRVKEDGPHNMSVVELLKELGFKHEGFVKGIDNSKEPRYIYTIPLKGKSEDELLNSFERKCMRSGKKAQKYKVEVEELQRDELYILDEVVAKTSERRGFAWRDNTYHQRLYDAFHAKGHVKFLVAKIDLKNYEADLKADLAKEEAAYEDACRHLLKVESAKMIKKRDLAQEQNTGLKAKLEDAKKMKEEDGEVLNLASGIFFVYGREILCLMSGVYEKYMRFCAPYMLHYTMMEECIKRGMERYNLYGTSGIFDESADDYGVFLFKKGFNGQVEELIGDFEIVLNKGAAKLYHCLQKVRSVLKKS